jgi:hypothetical protein
MSSWKKVMLSPASSGGGYWWSFAEWDQGDITNTTSSFSYTEGAYNYCYNNPIDSSGNIYGAFQFRRPYTGSTYNTTAIIYKIDPNGDVADYHAEQYGSSSSTSNDAYTDLTIDSSDNLYAVKKAKNLTAGVELPLTQKFNSSLALQWEDVEGNSNLQDPSVSVDGSGNVFTIFNWASGGEQNILIKRNSSGTILQRQTWNNPNYGPSYLSYARNTKVRGATTSPNGNILLLSTTERSGFWDAGGFSAINPSTGTVAYDGSYGNNSSGVVRNPTCAADSSNNVYLYAITDNALNSQGRYALSLRKYDTAGNFGSTFYLTNSVSNPGYPSFSNRQRKIAVDSSGYVYVVARGGISASQTNGYYIVKINTSNASNYTVEWERYFNFSTTSAHTPLDYAGLTIDADDDLRITYHSQFGNKSVGFIKYPSDGSITGTFSPTGMAGTPLIIGATSNFSLTSNTGSNISINYSINSTTLSYSSVLTATTPTITSSFINEPLV